MEGEKVYRTYSSAWDETGTDRPSNLGWEIRKAERKEFGVVYSIEWAGPLGWMGVRISMEMWEQGRFSIIMDMPWGGAHVAPKEVYLADETFYLTNRRIRSTFAHEIAHVRYYESIPNEYGKNKKRNNHRADCLASAMMGERFLPWYGCK
jgi:hypothetical protein